VLTSRERIRMALDHREPDRVPMHDSSWAATLALAGLASPARAGPVSGGSAVQSTACGLATAGSRPRAEMDPGMRTARAGSDP
jgi:hypothetical protein